MWSCKAPLWRIGLSERRLVRAAMIGTWPGREQTYDSLEWAPPENAEPWRGSVSALAQLLAAQGQGERAPVVQVVLSGSFVRWQVLPWQSELSGLAELATYARLRFTETFGKIASNWDVLHAPQPPGKAVPACAVDTALVQALRTVCADAGARLDLVTPYFASAVDRWCPTLKGQVVWFAAIEPQCVSLGLLRNGDWLGLNTQRSDGNWPDLLPGMMARIGVVAGLVPASAPLYLAGTGPRPAASAALPFVWLMPRKIDAGLDSGARLALGV